MAIKNSEDTRNVFGNSGDSVPHSKASKKAPEQQSYRREKEADKLREELLLKAQKEAEKEQKRLEKEAERRRKLEAMKQESLIQQASELRSEKKKNHSKDNKSNAASVSASTKPEDHASPVHNSYEECNTASSDAAFETYDEIWCEEIDEPPKVVETKPVPHQWENQRSSGFQRPKRDEGYIKRRSNTQPYKARMQSSRRDSYKVRSQSTSEYSNNKYTEGARCVTNAVCAPEPEVNVWEVRQCQMESIEQLKPHNESEEEAMLRQALELSRRQALEDQKKRSEIDEEYYLQMKYLSENPEFAAQLELNDQTYGATAGEDSWGSNDDYDNNCKSNRRADNDGFYSNSVRKSEKPNKDAVVSNSISDKNEFRGAKPKYKSYNQHDNNKSQAVQDECWDDVVQSYEFSSNNQSESTHPAVTGSCDDATWGDIEQSYESSDRKRINAAQDKCDDDDATWGDIEQSYESSNKKQTIYAHDNCDDDGTWGNIKPSYQSRDNKPVSAAQDNCDDEEDGTWDGVDQSFESSSRKQIVAEQPYLDGSNWECADLPIDKDKGEDCNKGNQDYLVNKEASCLDDQACLDGRRREVFNKNKMQVGSLEWSESMPDEFTHTMQSVGIVKKSSCSNKLQHCSDLQHLEMDEYCRDKADESKTRPTKHNEALISKPVDPVFKQSSAHSRVTDASNPGNFSWGEQPVPSHCLEDSHVELNRKAKKKGKSDDSEHDTWDEDLEHMLKSVKGVHFSSEEKSSTPNTESFDFTVSGSQPTINAAEPAANAVPLLHESHTKAGVNKVEQWLASTENQIEHSETSESGKSSQNLMKSEVPVSETAANSAPASIPSSISFPNSFPVTPMNNMATTDNSLLLNNGDMPVQVPLASCAANLLYPPHLSFGQPIVPSIDSSTVASSLFWQQAAMCANPFLMQQLHALQMFYGSRGVPIPQGLPVQTPLYPQYFNMLPPNPNIYSQQPVPGFPVSLPTSTAPNIYDQSFAFPTTPSPPGLSPTNVDPKPHEVSINPPVQPQQPSAVASINPPVQPQQPIAVAKLLGGSCVPDSDKKESFVGIHPPKPATTEIQRQPMYRYQDLCLMMQQSSTDRN